MIEPGVLVGGRYRIERELSSGGMGTVWLAHHVQLDVDVAVKVISGKLTPILIERFKREAQAAAKLGGPNIVRVLDYGVHESQPYLAMELLRGVDLATRIEVEGCIAPEAAARILRDVGRGVQLAHNAGIVHRDLKPANVFLERVDDVDIAKVLDFGIAKDLQSASEGRSLTGDGSVGSPMYMSPEQIFGLEVDFRTDIWSLGVVAFEMLTGVNPFSADRLAKIYDLVTREPIPSASSCNGNLPKEVDIFFERALARAPEQRFESARELATTFADTLGLSRSLLPSSADLKLTPSLLSFASTQAADGAASVREPLSMPRVMGGATTQAATTVPANSSSSAANGLAARSGRLKRVGAVVLALGALGIVSAVLGSIMSTQREQAPRDESGSLPTEAGPALTGAPAGEIAPDALALPARPIEPTPASSGDPGPSDARLKDGGFADSLPCVVKHPPRACSHPNIIDDMEDNNGTVCPHSGRTGNWTVFQDGTSEIYPSRGDQIVTSLIPGCRASSARAIHIHGKGFTDWGAGVAVHFSAEDRALTDLTKYRALQFWARSSVPTDLRVGVALRQTLEATYGGDCVTTPSDSCNDHFVARRSLSPRWGLYTVSFSEMSQEGWGVPAPFDLTQGMQVHFHVPRPKDMPKLDIDLWIDDAVLLDK